VPFGIPCLDRRREGQPWRFNIRCHSWLACHVVFSSDHRSISRKPETLTKCRRAVVCPPSTPRVEATSRSFFSVANRTWLRSEIVPATFSSPSINWVTVPRSRYGRCDPGRGPLPVWRWSCALQMRASLAGCVWLFTHPKSVKEIANVSPIKRKLIENPRAIASCQKLKTVAALSRA
jgi:hypothetical protein